mgnify:CR=1 FL=1
MRSEIFLGDCAVFVNTVFNGICQSGKWIVNVGTALAQTGCQMRRWRLLHIGYCYYCNRWSGSCCRCTDGDWRKESYEGVSRELLGCD